MTPSQFAAANILPFLARVVLFLAFMPQGWNNLMAMREYTGPEAQRLRELGVRGVTDEEPASTDVSLGAVRGEWPQDAPRPTPPNDPPRGPMANDPPRGSKPSDAAPVTPPQQPAATPATPPSTGPLPAPRAERLSPLAPLKERKLYAMALIADGAHLPFPTEIAWAVAAVQLVGGACILLGMFSRVWALLIAVILAWLFVTVTRYSVTGVWFFGMSASDINLVFAQMGLFVMALMVFLVGPGAFSMDRALFRRSRTRRSNARST
ncbi:MAG: DoxX family membrane protein [Phycisphaerales bacterium]